MPCGKLRIPSGAGRALVTLDGVPMNDRIARWVAVHPVVAARLYGYSSVAFFETLVPWSPSLRPLGGQLNGLEAVPQPSLTLEEVKRELGLDD